MKTKLKSVREILDEYAYAENFLLDNHIPFSGQEDLCIDEILSSMKDSDREEYGLDSVIIVDQLEQYIQQMQAFLEDKSTVVESITVFPGTDKSGKSEVFDRLDLRAGEIVSIVGPTGSGKSRLLADIEWVAQKDTPTRRTVYVNNEVPDTKWRFSISDKLVAQLSQNMNFVMDLSVEEFVRLHAESRMIEDIDSCVEKIIENANNLAGEKFSPEIPITSLSGGQSRALMIADTAELSKSPVILIDEIENAGIDRKKALELLLSEDKIVLMATHDPVLALLGEKRIVIKNGGIDKIIVTTDKEREMLAELETLDKRINHLRNALRNGEILN